MHAYQFLYGYPKQYPAIQDAEGKSLMANPGDVVEFETPPNDGCWFPVDPPADNPPETPAPETPPAGPEPAPEAPVAEPEPEPVQPDPEPAPAPAAPAEPPPVQPQPFAFPGFGSYFAPRA